MTKSFEFMLFSPFCILLISLSYLRNFIYLRIQRLRLTRDQLTEGCESDHAQD
jgi:hypothetical protein